MCYDISVTHRVLERHMLRVLLLLISFIGSAACNGSREEPSRTKEPTSRADSLRSFGVHYNPRTGLLAVVAGDVIATIGEYPAHTVAFANGPVGALDQIPSTCRGTMGRDSVDVYQALGATLQYRSLDDTERESRPYLTAWQQATIRLDDCGSLSGTYFGTGARIPSAPSPLDFHERASSWRVHLSLNPQLVGSDPSFTVHRFQEFTFDPEGSDDGSWTRSSDLGASTDDTGIIRPSTTGDPSLFGEPLARSTVDRPGPNVWDVKVLYATYADGPDDQRDTNGQIVSIASGLSDFFARQRPGFRLRFDTFDGSLDVQHIPLSITRDEFRNLFTDRGDELEYFLRGEFARAGLPFEWSLYDDSEYGTENRMYLMFMEGPRGLKFGGDGKFVEYECGRVSELQSGARIVGINLRKNDGSECETITRFEESGGTDFWPMAFDALRFLTVSLLELPNCDAVTRAEIDRPLEERLENIVPDDDVASNEWKIPSSPEEEPRLDPLRSFYFQIENGPFAGDRCRDIVFSPFWEEDSSGEPDDPITGTRSEVDRPNDTDLPRLKVFYVLPNGATDRRLDLRMDASIETANAWLENQTGKRFRFDTHDGKIDATFVALEQYEEEFWRSDDGIEQCETTLCPSPDTLLTILLERGLVSDDELAVILYEGHVSPVNPSTGGCYAGGSHVVLYAKCLSSPLTTPLRTDTSESTLGLRLIHEVFHTLGAVGGGAPNGDGPYDHIRGDSNDLMAIGERTAWEIDPGRDDYWGHGRNDFVDISKSIFLEPTAVGANFPDRWQRPP